jgi:hypothetical protein
MLVFPSKRTIFQARSPRAARRGFPARPAQRGKAATAAACTAAFTLTLAGAIFILVEQLEYISAKTPKTRNYKQFLEVIMVQVDCCYLNYRLHQNQRALLPYQATRHKFLLPIPKGKHQQSWYLLISSFLFFHL